MIRYADLFTGFGGATIGAMAAGLLPIWGIERDARIAAVANRNLGGHIMAADILDVDPATLAPVDVLHASPPCPNFSAAKSDNGETQLDIDLATKIAQFVSVIQPRIFTLENVYAYRNSQSWLAIQDALFLAGYWVSIEHINFADFGVPQTRKRMIVRAVRGGWIPYLPHPQKWVGWYEAIEDLIPTLPESKFAPWQEKRRPLSSNSYLMPKSDDKFGDGLRWQNEPAQTITANEHGSRASLRDGRVVSMTPRALARFQSFPDWYQLPDDNKALATRGIGNAVPPLGAQRIYEGLS